MPRLNFPDYLNHRQMLIQHWRNHDGMAFGDLPLQCQRDLHDYFAPSARFTDKEALAHRTAMTNAFPMLPQKAGRAFRAFCAVLDGTPNLIADKRRTETTTVEVIGTKRYSFRIAAVARPVVDHYRLARALLNLTKDPVVSSELDGMVEKRRRRRGRS